MAPAESPPAAAAANISILTRRRSVGQMEIEQQLVDSARVQREKDVRPLRPNVISF